MNYIGDFSEDSTVRIVLTTNNTSGAAVAPSSAFEADDFRIYKNGSATQKATTNGITVASPFDSVTGLHTLEIDTSNDTGDSGFWTTGADYWIIAVPDETVDSQTVVGVIATFSIQNRYSSARLAAIEADTLDIQSRIPDALENGRMKASVSGTGSGARTVTITVTLNGTPVEGALIRLTKAAESYLGTTDEDGEEVFNVNDGTWTVAITAANASFDGDELVVNGDETPIYPMTATSFTASSASLVTGYWTCYSHLGVVESGVTITMICKKVPAESGFALDSATRTATSGADGIAQFANLIPGATYQVARGSGQNFMIKVPDDATGTIELNSILGS